MPHLTQARAGRLARRAAERDRGGPRGVIGRRAWERLLRAGDRHDQAAIDIVWQVWLREPGSEQWAALSRWLGAGQLAEQAFAAATDPGRPPGERAAIGTFCAGHGLAPENPAERVLFYALSGQAGQGRAADPDGSLLAAVYQGAPDAVRAALRRALADAAEVDLVRVIAGRQDRPLTVTERGYLQDQLVRRRDWAGLWPIVRDLPLADAVVAVRGFGDGWHPDEEAERALFTRLARVSPEALRRARLALTNRVAGRIGTAGQVRSGTFSPDGRRLAVWVAGKAPGHGTVQVISLPGGGLVRRDKWYQASGDKVSIALTGEALIVADQRLSGRGGYRLRRCADGPVRVLPAHQGARVAAVAPCFAGPGSDGGFAVLTHSQLLLCDASGAVTGSVSPTDMLNRAYSWRLPRQRLTRLRWTKLASHPSGRLAVAGGGFVLVMVELGSAEPQCIAHGQIPADANGLCFCGPKAVAVTSVTAGVQLLAADWGMTYPGVPDGLRARVPGARCPVADPSGGQVAVLSAWGAVHYLDAETLGPAPWALQGALEYEFGRCLFSSPDGRYHARGDDEDSVTVDATAAARELAALADAPPAQWRPADLATVRAAALVPEFAPAATWLYDLLTAALERRFGTDVAIGRGMSASADDIALAGGGAR